MNKKTKKKEPINSKKLPESTNSPELTNKADLEAKTRREHKDTIFRMIFKEKANMLSLYNALNQTTYTDVDDLEVTTLENAVYMTYKNDVSFIFDYELMLYEHQSTRNPNMPLRDLIYVTAVLKGLTINDDLYDTKQIKLPAPRFAVFYNGETKEPERHTLRLSDAYKKKQDNPELELTVTVYNINYGHNPQLLETCQLLNEYARFVSVVRKYAKKMSIAEAVVKAVDYCIKRNILRDFLLKNRAEAIDVCIYEYNAEKHMKNMQNNAYQQGRNETLIKIVESAMQNFGLSLEEACKGLGIDIEEYQTAKTLN